MIYFFRMNDGVEGTMKNVANSNGLFDSEFKRFQMQFRHQIDSLKTPNMCHVFQESYLFMKVNHTFEGPI